MDDFRPRLGRKRGARAGGLVISRPGRGSRPLRPARLVTTKVPKPLMVTRRPLRSDSKIEARKAFMARSADVLEPPVVFAMIAIRSAFVIPWGSWPFTNGGGGHRLDRHRG